ncbi:sugar ABC transporter permease [Streptomyces sp. MUM 178J]|uniref:sugar ABC transporter permease n=1 Tax=Streptomyces sp. MUM 178J TaxID=2791991 RepID=UPI001F039CC6|nr:sugar ABC transporter permease [Streptomyces sp. MUM 178J]WRQ79114.1 sugar ABC transporter permease [Streptomyces sp. MUM 178J]
MTPAAGRGEHVPSPLGASGSEEPEVQAPGGPPGRSLGEIEGRDPARRRPDCPSWTVPALDTALARVALTRAAVGDRFPLFAEPDGDGRWTTTSRGSWTGGFWAGLQWLRALRTGDVQDRVAARAATARLARWAEADTATRGLILWYGTAHAAGDPDATALRERAAHACLAAMDPDLGLVPWGAAFGGERLLARADGAPGMGPLLTAAGPAGRAAAESHLRRHLALCLGGRHPAWRFDGTGWQPCEEPPPDWSRGHAWLLLAVAEGTALGMDLSAERERLTASLESAPLVPHADASHCDVPLDTSAAAITAVALLMLARADDSRRRAGRFRARAVAVLDRLVHAHMASGRLLDGCYDAGSGLAVRHQLIWGDYFLVLGLAALTGLVDL